MSSPDPSDDATDAERYVIATRSLNELYGEEDPEEWFPYMPSDE